MQEHCGSILYVSVAKTRRFHTTEIEICSEQERSLSTPNHSGSRNLNVPYVHYTRQQTRLVDSGLRKLCTNMGENAERFPRSCGFQPRLSFAPGPTCLRLHFVSLGGKELTARQSSC